MSAEQELAIIKHKNERIEELAAVNEQLTNALESVYHVTDGYEEQVQMLKARVREVLGENARLTARVEQLEAELTEARRDGERWRKVIQGIKDQHEIRCQLEDGAELPGWASIAIDTAIAQEEVAQIGENEL